MPGNDCNLIAVGKIRLDLPKLAELETSVRSPDVSIANLPWSLEVKCSKDNSNIRQFGVYAHCKKVDESPHWSCKASIMFNLLSPKVGQKSYSVEPLVDTFSAKKTYWGYPEFIKCDKALDPKNGFIRKEDGGVVFEATITVTKVIGLPVSRLCDFTAPRPNLTDVALIVEAKPLHVSKTYLAFHSSFFHSLFFSEFAEKTKKEIPLEDVEYEEFVELLHVIFPSHKPVTVYTVESLLRLADRFGMQFVLHSCEEFLRGPNSKEIPIAKKLLWSDQYRLASLQSICLQSLKSFPEIKALKASKEFGEFSSKMKDELAERILEMG